jgi:hypothetical protein
MLDKTIIANQSTLQRSKVSIVIAPMSAIDGTTNSTTPGLWQIFDLETETWAYSSYLPSAQGQIMVITPGGGDYATMYVAVNEAGILLWKPVKIASSAINPDTGKTWDPLQNF